MAKREYKPKYHHINKVWPVFIWLPCFKCGMEFRRMRGWHVVTGPYFNGVGRNQYVCGDCATSPEEVEAIMEASRQAALRMVIRREEPT